MATYSEYWQVVLGARTAAQVVAEFDLTGGTRRGLSEWLGTAEEEAIRACHLPREETLDAWARHHERAVTDLDLAGSAS